jgi:hypothetical protein
MSNYFVFVDDLNEIRQGDIIRQISGTPPHRKVWGVIITADCDIAQRKAGNRYTWLEIITFEDYLKMEWAPGQLRKLIEKQSQFASEGLNGLIKRAGLDLAPLSPISLRTWLSDTTAEDIITSIIGQNRSIDKKLLAAVKAIEVALNRQDDCSELARLRKAWEILGKDEKQQQNDIRSAFKGDGGFLGYILIPELPDTERYGFVVMLRSIFSLESSDLFKSEVDARINDKPDAFHRIGRFSDRLRFSITQKVAFLFSRIGMTEGFEEACEVTTDMAIEAIYMKSTNENSI